MLTMVTLLRFYLLFRVFILGSFWADEKAERICRDVCNTQGGSMFVLRCEMKERPFTIICFSQIIVIFVFGYAVRVAELYVHLTICMTILIDPSRLNLTMDSSGSTCGMACGAS